jgi:hypothetical protein
MQALKRAERLIILAIKTLAERNHLRFFQRPSKNFPLQLRSCNKFKPEDLLFQFVPRETLYERKRTLFQRLRNGSLHTNQHGVHTISQHTTRRSSTGERMQILTFADEE